MSITDYIISFYFWSDIISIGVLIFDLAIVRERISRIDKTGGNQVSIIFFDIIDILRIVRMMSMINLIF